MKQKSDAEFLLGLIYKGEYKPDSDLRSLPQVDGSELMNDPSGIGWYISCAAGGVPVRTFDTDPKLRREPRHRMPRR